MLRRTLTTTRPFSLCSSSIIRRHSVIRPLSTSASVLTNNSNKPSNKMSSNNNNDQATYTDQAKSAAGIAAGHAQYAQGAATEAIGSATGSSDWQQSGADTKQAGADAIREAFNNAPEGGKAGQLAEQACPQVGDGVGDDGSSSNK